MNDWGNDNTYGKNLQAKPGLGYWQMQFVSYCKQVE